MTWQVNLLNKIDHIVVIMLENRSFDQMLGYLYAEQGNVSPLGHAYEGLTGKESNPDENGKQISVYKIPEDQHPYFWPGSDPGEGYNNTNSQLFGNYKTPKAGSKATNQGFITDFAYTLKWQRRANQKKANSWQIVTGTKASDIMAMYPPELLPVLSGLAKAYAVCDHWYCSVPTETLPNRAFVQMATSLGRLNDHDKVYNATSIFNLLEQAKESWAIYGYEDGPILTRQSLSALPRTPEHGSFGNLKAFKMAAKAGDLASYSFLTPEWGASGNSQHPNYDVAKGEQYLLEIYQALHSSPAWEKTLLVITYDEHGGNYDHVAPPENAAQAADCPDNDGFNFQRFGVRVPTVLVSPLIEAGTVFRVPEGKKAACTPFDHTSILATVEKRFGLPSLTARDNAAPDIGGVLTLSNARIDDPMKKVIAPLSKGKPNMENGDTSTPPDHLQYAEAHLASQLPAHGDYHSHYTHHFDDENEAKRYARDRYHQYYDGGEE